MPLHKNSLFLQKTFCKDLYQAHGFLSYSLINPVITRNYSSRDVNVDIMFAMNIFSSSCRELLGAGRHNTNKFRLRGTVFSTEFPSWHWQSEELNTPLIYSQIPHVWPNDQTTALSKKKTTYRCESDAKHCKGVSFGLLNNTCLKGMDIWVKNNIYDWSE